MLADELGLEPGVELRDLQSAVLRQDPALDWRPPGGPPAAPVPPAHGPGSGRSSVRLGQIESVVPSLPPWPMVGRDDQLAAVLEPLGARRRRGVGVRRRSPGSRGSARAGWRRAGSRARRAGCRRAASDGARRTTARRRCGRGAGAPRDGAGPARSCPTTSSAPFRAWEERRTRRWTPPASAPWSSSSTTCTGPTSRPAGAAPARRDAVDAGGCWWSAPGATAPEPTGALADVAEALARRHALRLELHGLDRAGGDRRSSRRWPARSPPRRRRDALAQRTDGNPFFLVEYARLASEGGGLGGLWARSTRRQRSTTCSCAACAAPGRRRHRSALARRCVGRQFDLPTLADVPRRRRGRPARPARPGPGVRAAARGRDRPLPLRATPWSATRSTARSRPAAGPARTRGSRARSQGQSGRETELARHWLAAGPSYAAARLARCGVRGRGGPAPARLRRGRPAAGLGADDPRPRTPTARCTSATTSCATSPTPGGGPVTGPGWWRRRRRPSPSRRRSATSSCSAGPRP